MRLPAATTFVALSILLALPGGASASDPPTPLEHACALQSSGVLRYVQNPATCHPPYERAISILPGPTYVCAGPLGLLVRKVGSPAECGSSTALTLPSSTPVYFCAAVRIGGWLRHVTAPSRCFDSELALVVAPGNRAPTIEVATTPGPGDPFQMGDSVAYTVTVTDDAAVDCSRVAVVFVLGHDTHGHPQQSITGCSGVVETFNDEGHPGPNVFALIATQYVDSGGLVANDEVVLTPNP